MSGFAAKAAADYCDDLVLVRLGALEVRLVAKRDDFLAAARLRHAVFCLEKGLPARPGGVETDRFDSYCDHIIVWDTRSADIIATCRLLRPRSGGDCYSDGEFDLAGMFSAAPDLRFCEVGRSCVDRRHRNQSTLEALWCGLFAYALRHRIDAYFGAASFPGTDPAAHAMALSWLYHHAHGPLAARVQARPSGAVGMDILPRPVLDNRLALRQLPPLLRGYLKIGAQFARSAFVDPAFGTTDVFVLAPLADAPPPWRRRFEALTGPRRSAQPRAVGIAPDML